MVAAVGKVIAISCAQPRLSGGWLVLSGDKEKNGSGTRRNQDHSVFDVSEPLQLADRLPGLLWRKAHLSAQLPVRVLVSDSAIGFGDRGELIENHSGGDLRCVHEQNTTDTRFGRKAKDLQISNKSTSPTNAQGKLVGWAQKSPGIE